MRRFARLAVAATVSLGVGPLACGNGFTEAPEPASTSPAPSASTTGDPFDPNWPPPFFLHLVAYYSELNNVSIVRATDDAVFAYSEAGRIWRAGLTADQPPHDWFTCGQCVLDFQAEDDFVYFLQATQLVRTSSADGPWSADRPEDRFEMPFDHMSGTMTADSEYIYSAVSGCSRVTRFRKPEMTYEVMEFDVPYVVDAGSTELWTRAGGGIVCGQPNGVVTADSWGGATRTLAEVPGLRSLGATETAVYWIERRGDSHPVVAMLSWTDEAVIERFETPDDAGDFSEGCVLPGTEKFAFPQFRSAGVFDGETRTFSSIELGGRPHSFECTERGLYAAIEGPRERGPGFAPSDDWAYWISFIPMDIFEE